MKLIDHAGRVAKRAWSMRMIYASVVLGAIDVSMPFFAPAESSRVFGLLSVLVGVAAGVSRVISQPGLSRDA